MLIDLEIQKWPLHTEQMLCKGKKVFLLLNDGNNTHYSLYIGLFLKSIQTLVVQILQEIYILQ